MTTRNLLNYSVQLFRSILCNLVADRNPRVAGRVDGGLEIGQALYVVDKFLDAPHTGVSCVMGRKAAADFKFRFKRREIIL